MEKAFSNRLSAQKVNNNSQFFAAKTAKDFGAQISPLASFATFAVKDGFLIVAHPAKGFRMIARIDSLSA